jgi:hypothetical protein
VRLASARLKKAHTHRPLLKQSLRNSTPANDPPLQAPEIWAVSPPPGRRRALARILHHDEFCIKKRTCPLTGMTHLQFHVRVPCSF